MGIPPAVLPHIFEPFFTTKEEGKGTGMGLAAVYGIMKTHNGGVSVQSKPGAGSLFKLYFPQTAAPKQITGNPATNLIVHTPEKCRILLVDDEADVANTIKDMLERLGYEVTVKTSGRAAIDFYLQAWPEVNLVLLDMIMPEINGSELFHMLKKINPQLKAILSSGYVLTSQIKEILQEGVLLFIQKPYTMAELAQKLQIILNPEKTVSSSPLMRKRTID
jgi:CheY-like chemotaxis protein